ncbi:MAG: tetratricopeptide repeat protein [Chitinophagaceae bacterium]
MSDKIIRILSDPKLLKVEVEKIKASRNISIEIRQFLSYVDKYQQLKTDIEAKEANLLKASLSGQSRSAELLTAELKTLTDLEQSFILDLLAYAETIHKTEYAQIAGSYFLKELLYEGKLGLSDTALQPAAIDVIAEETEKLAIADEALKEVYHKLLINAKEFMIKANLTALNYELPDRFEKTILFFEKSLHSAAHADAPENYFSSLYAFGNFLLNYKQFDKAGANFEKCLPIADKLILVDQIRFVPEKARTYWSLALVHTHNNKNADASLAFNKAVALYQKAISLGSYEYFFDIAKMQNAMGALHFQTKQFKEAELHYKNTILFFNQYRAFLGQSDLSHLADTYHNLANVQSVTGQFENAIRNYREAEAAYKKIAENDSKTYELENAVVYSNLSVLYLKSGDLEMAAKTGELALDLTRKINLKDRETTTPHLARAIGNLTNVYCRMLAFDKANTLLTEAVPLYRKLTNENSQSFQFELARLLSNSAELNRLQGRNEAALANLKEANEIFKPALEADYDAIAPDAAEVLSNLGLAYGALQNFPEAESTLLKAIAIYRDYAKKAPTVYSLLLSRNLNNLGDVYRNENKIALSLACLQEAFDLLSNGKVPQTLDRKILQSAVAMNWANTLVVASQFPAAKTKYLEALKIAKELWNDDPVSNQPNLAKANINLSLFFLNYGKDKQLAFFHAKETIRLAQPFLATIPESNSWTHTAIQIINHLRNTA